MNNNKILNNVWERIIREKSDSEITHFNNLMYLGEVFTKVTCLFMIAGLNDSQKNYRYTQLYNLVRANGVGDYSSSLNELLTGPSSQEIKLDFNKFAKELNDKTVKGEWQNKAIAELLNSLRVINSSPSIKTNKVQLKTWFGYFANLRNKTRGHGAISIDDARQINGSLEKSLELVLLNFTPFKLQWAYLSQNLSGKYKVIGITENADNFAYLRTQLGSTNYFETGIYFYLNGPIRIDLIETDENLKEFYFPNGSFNKNRYELLSYSSGAKLLMDGTGYLSPPGELPLSETKGGKEIRVLNHCFTNIPELTSIYVSRESLETELLSILNNQRHPILTLIGRGGVGKTTLALNVLHQISETKRFNNIFWFSSRDIDLLDVGAKQVQPDILKIEDVIKSFSSLVGPDKEKLKYEEKEELFKLHLSSTEDCSLFVFDNFETVTDQSSLFSWLDSNVRLPNKILITSRINEFKADYPINIGGMEYTEFKTLVQRISEELDISSIITPRYVDQLYEESTGHPYVAKILLGQVANENKLGDIKRIIADKENVLQALFERTYNQLSTASRRVFLTLGSWRTTIPETIVEAVLKAGIQEAIDIEGAIEELYRYSLVDKQKTKMNDTILSLPISAHLFAEKKIKTDIYQLAISKDIEVLMMFGVGRNTEIELGISNRIAKFIKNIAKEIANESSAIDKYVPILDYICIKNPEYYLIYSTLLEEFNFIESSIEACNKYIGAFESSKTIPAWKKLIQLYQNQKNYVAEISSHIKLANIEESSNYEISNLLKRYTHLLKVKVFRLESEKKLLTESIIQLTTSQPHYNNLNNADITNLAWIYLHNGNKAQALNEAKKVINIEPNNPLANRLLEKLKV